MNDELNIKLRIDKWLWAARFFKTRSLAADAVENGKVMCNNVRIKPAKPIGVGDRLNIRVGKFEFEIDVLALSNKRGPAPQAQKLYRETEASLQKRAALVAELKAQPEPPTTRGRPTKRDRREIDQFKRGAW
jgi:ribosome-associated heat shock protein Hsp15